MNKNSGFTLVELIVVIVILGILSAVAIPKFINVTFDTRIATLNGIAAQVRHVSNMGIVMCMLSPDCNEAAAGSIVTIDGVNYRTSYGSLYAVRYAGIDGLSELLNISGLIRHNDSNWVIWYFEETGTNCGVFYQPSHFYGVLKPVNINIRTSSC
jgi:MSHA pilin protein MshA